MTSRHLQEALRANPQLLALVIDEEVIAIIKTRLSAEDRAELALELINPYRALKTEQIARLGGVTASAIRKRTQRA